MTFVINLLLNGVMSQLWNIFNTLQIILALPLLSVMMPSNVILVQDVLLQIVNFQPIDKEEIYGSIVEPVFEDDSQETDSNGMLKSILLYLLVFIIFAILIGVLVVCKICLLPKCCSCF